MANERISSIAQQSVFDEIDRIQKGLLGIEKHIATIDLNLGDTKSLSQANGLLVELSVNTEKVTQKVNEQVAARKQLSAAEKEDLQFQKELEKQGKANLSTLLAIEKAKQREAKVTAEATSAYKILSKAYQDAALRAKDYSLTLGAQHPITLQAVADAQAMDARLKQLDATVGQHQRSVGNYNMVGAQFNQLLREMPNAAMGMRTMVMSLSNNLGYFAEALVQSRQQAGSWGGALAGLATRSNLLVMGINLAVTALTFLGMAMANSKKDTKELADETDDLTRAYARNIEALRKRRDLFNIYNRGQKDNEAALKREIDLLKAKGADELEILEAERAYNKVRIKNIQDEKTAIEGLIYATNTLFERQKGRRIPLKDAEQDKEVIEDLIGTIQRQTKVTEEEARKQAEAIVREYRATGGIITSLEEERAQRAIEIADLEAGEQIRTYEFQRTLKEEIKKEDEQAQRDAEKRLKEHYQRLRQIEKERGSIAQLPTSTGIAFQIRTEQYQQMTAGIEAAEIQLQKSIEQQYANGEITIKQYEEAKKLATEEAAKKRLQTELDYLKNVTDLVYNPTLRAQMMQRIQEAELEVLEIGNERKKRLYEQDEKDRVEAEKKANDKIKAERQALFTALQALSSVARDLLGIQSDQLGARIQQLQKEGQLIQINGNAEIEKIKASQLADAEKEKAIREQLALTESERIANEARQREAARRKAAFDKSSAITQIILDTSIAVLKALTDETTPYVVRVVNAASAGAIGAAQLARAASAPVPQYEQGTLNHPGGKFIAGEKEKELVIRPDGRAYWTADKPALYNEPKGTKVFNSEMINTVAGAALTPQLVKAVSKGTDNNANKMAVIIEGAIERTGKETVRAIHRNRAIQNVNVTSPDFYYQVKVKGKA